MYINHFFFSKGQFPFPSDWVLHNNYIGSDAKKDSLS